MIIMKITEIRTKLLYNIILFQNDYKRLHEQEFARGS